MDHSEVKYLPTIDHAPAKLDKPSKLLLKAAALIEEYGLAKHIQCDTTGRLCAVGAIVKADGGVPYGEGNLWTGARSMTKVGLEAHKRFAEALAEITPLQSDPIASWNNTPERTADEVIAKLRAVALSG